MKGIKLVFKVDSFLTIMIVIAIITLYLAVVCGVCSILSFIEVVAFYEITGINLSYKTEALAQLVLTISQLYVVTKLVTIKITNK